MSICYICAQKKAHVIICSIPTCHECNSRFNGREEEEEIIVEQPPGEETADEPDEYEDAYGFIMETMGWDDL